MALQKEADIVKLTHEHEKKGSKEVFEVDRMTESAMDLEVTPVELGEWISREEVSEVEGMAGLRKIWR